MKPKNHHPSERQLAANRANTAKPRTPEGKEKASRSAITHGISVVKPVLTSKDEPEYNTLERLLHRDFDPRCAAEEALFQEILEIKWTKRRIRLIEHAQIELTIIPPDPTAEWISRNSFRPHHPSPAPRSPPNPKHKRGKTKPVPKSNTGRAHHRSAMCI